MVKSGALRGAEGNLTAHHSGNNRAETKMGRELGGSGAGAGPSHSPPMTCRQGPEGRGVKEASRGFTGHTFPPFHLHPA